MTWIGGILGFFGFMILTGAPRLYQGIAQMVLYPVLFYIFSGANDKGDLTITILIPSGLVFLFFAWLTYLEWRRGPD